MDVGWSGFIRWTACNSGGRHVHVALKRAPFFRAPGRRIDFRISVAFAVPVAHPRGSVHGSKSDSRNLRSTGFGATCLVTSAYKKSTYVLSLNSARRYA